MTYRPTSLLLNAGLALAVASVAFASASEAASKKRQYQNDRPFDYRTPVRRDPNSYDYARARNIDPARDYGSYPDWAAYALSPKNDNSRR